MKYWIGKLWLRLFDWELSGETSLPPRFVIIASPHTSNWDLAFMLAASYVLGIKISWIGKHTLFRGLKGYFLRRVGGIPVDRRSPQNLVEQIVTVFSTSDSLALAVPPEGTRGKAQCWKSGFYHIARLAGVPIGLGYLDYGRRRCGIGGFLLPSGDLCADMDFIRATSPGGMGATSSSPFSSWARRVS